MAVALLVLGALLGASLSRLPLGRSAAVAGGALVGFAVLDMAAFVWLDADVPPAALLVLPPLAWIGVQGYLRRVSDRLAREHERELSVARTIQQHMLPATPPDVPELEVCGINLPATAVGGDYFDWLPLGDDELAVVLGDVSGHGVPAAILMSHLRASFHAEARPGRSPSEIVHSMNVSLSRAISPGKFATFFLALISRREPRLRFCNAGHNPPLLVRGGAQTLLQATGIPLGMMDLATYTDEAHDFGPGDVLVIYSDGIPEAPVHHDFYGDERLRARVADLTSRPRPAAEIATAMLDDVRQLAGAQLATDDVTLVVLRRL
jgi:sigma-B regulation protein RsbU (phosphoserine phosphatase)